ncbi:glucose-1-phosphate adenylyltransferase [Longilinea arvoryzae]|uniref:Glucose-1-phosphate adenylyltransferase n=1 Tax=Longilinea arvoryzae TaxID=360412 RepID=A0A0S7BB67_9CHLR|nr:glucose-1-phosphate adenylyltransferase [Longilinea arvoryzae]GAP15007.1 glucose-1-phosphate adenylyltransferase [Longilinea arvoryzae]
MKTRVIILAGGEGTRLGVLTAKRTKPAVPFAGKYRIIDFALSNCVNSGISDVMLVAQYRPHSLIEHIGSGGPWDLNREITGGISILTPYRARNSSWFVGTADAIQQNFTFIKHGDPDFILILSGDHIYSMDYREMIQFHQEHQADLTLATISVPVEEASRFGIVGIGPNQRVTSFVEKPVDPPSNMANMGVYLFNRDLLDKALWDDHLKQDSSHDFGKDILPDLIRKGLRVFAFPFTGYWVDVGTVASYWKAHMDLVSLSPAFDLYNPHWIIHTRSEERPPMRILKDAVVEDSLVSNGCIIESGARVVRSILSAGVRVGANAVVEESILLTDAQIAPGSTIQRCVIDKRVKIGGNTVIGGITEGEPMIAMVGKNAVIPAGMTIGPGAMVGPDVIPEDFSGPVVESGVYVQTRRLPNEV